MDTLIKYNDQNILDFLLTYKGKIEDLFVFLQEQNINYEDFSILPNKIYSTYVKNIVTNYYINKRIYVTNKVDGFEVGVNSFSEGFNTGFNRI